MEPLTTYRIVVQEGIMAANGMDESEEPYVIEFKTSAMTPCGLTVFQILLIVLVSVMVLAGIIAAAIKAKTPRPLTQGTAPRVSAFFGKGKHEERHHRNHPYDLRTCGVYHLLHRDAKWIDC